jgi:hypothetical protein
VWAVDATEGIHRTVTGGCSRRNVSDRDGQHRGPVDRDYYLKICNDNELLQIVRTYFALVSGYLVSDGIPSFFAAPAGDLSRCAAQPDNCAGRWCGLIAACWRSTKSASECNATVGAGAQ